MLTDFVERVRSRRLRGMSERGRSILGEPGIGKSVAVMRLAQRATEEGDWVTGQIRFPKEADPFQLMARALDRVAKDVGLPRAEETASVWLRRLQRLSIAAVGSVEIADEPEPMPHLVLFDALVALGREAARSRQLLLVHLDEVQNIDLPALSQLLVAVGDALAYTYRADLPGGETELYLPLAVYLTGLPDFADRAMSDAGATFARRFKTTVLEPLSDEEVRAALWSFVTDGWAVEEPQASSVTMTADAVDGIVQRCLGDPYVFQLAGQAAWLAGDSSSITIDDVASGWATITPEVRRHVERQLARIPGRERELLEALAQLDSEERTLSAAARLLGVEPASVSTYAQRLDTTRNMIVRGKPYRIRARAVEAYLRDVWP